jgi:hypothetical protein
MTGDRWSDALALIAGVVGLVAIALVWPTRRRAVEVARLRHPSSPPPVSVMLDTSGDDARWRVMTPMGVLTTTVDIVTWRQSDTSLPWSSEPIVDPIVLAPGSSTLLDTVVEPADVPYDVVIAWTVRHLSGDLQGSRTWTVRPTASVPTPRFDRPRARGLLAYYLVIGALTGLITLVAGWRLVSTHADDTSRPAAASAPDGSTAPPVTSGSGRSAGTTVPATTDAVGAVTSPAGPSTTGITSTTPQTTTPDRSTTIAPPLIRPPTVDTDGRTVTISGRVEDCRFGAQCVIASFTLEGFPPTGEYVCEFDDGTRFTFRYVDAGADDACAISGPSPSITIEVDGVRSATITREAPEGG